MPGAHSGLTYSTVPPLTIAPSPQAQTPVAPLPIARVAISLTSAGELVEAGRLGIIGGVQFRLPRPTEQCTMTDILRPSISPGKAFHCSSAQCSSAWTGKTSIFDTFRFYLCQVYRS